MRYEIYDQNEELPPNTINLMDSVYKTGMIKLNNSLEEKIKEAIELNGFKLDDIKNGRHKLEKIDNDCLDYYLYSVDKVPILAEMRESEFIQEKGKMSIKKGYYIINNKKEG